MRILLLGKNGQLGWEIERSLLPLGDVIALGRKDVDLLDHKGLRKNIRALEPNIIINAAAYTDVNRAEKEEDIAYEVNGVAPGIIAEEAERINAALIHYSTDYIYDGNKRSPYLESDEPNPINAYGRTKLAGEIAVQSTGCAHIIFRTSWIYSDRGNNFLLKILDQASREQDIKVVNDQSGSPTWARNIADILLASILSLKEKKYISRPLSDVYHIASDGCVTWFDYARQILLIGASCGLNNEEMVDRVKSVSSDEFRTSVERPQYSVLSTGKLESDFGLSPISWIKALECCIGSIKTK